MNEKLGLRAYRPGDDAPEGAGGNTAVSEVHRPRGVATVTAGGNTAGSEPQIVGGGLGIPKQQVSSADRAANITS